MKKVLLTILFCLAFGICHSQSIEYSSSNIGVSFCGNYCTQEESSSGDISVSMLFYNYICTDLYSRTTLNLHAFNFPEYVPYFNLGLGVEYRPIGYFYCFAEVFPGINVVGIGPQSSGDYAAIYLPLDLGIGYNFEFVENHSLYVELYFEKEFTIYAALEQQIRNGINIGFTIGYSYAFYKDIR